MEIDDLTDDEIAAALRELLARELRRGRENYDYLEKLMNRVRELEGGGEG